jgi:cobalt/nickel transport system permease protein
MSGAVGNPAIEAFHEIERRRGGTGAVPSVARLGVAVAFLVVLMSFGKYELAQLSALAVYPFSLACFERVPLFSAFFRFRFLLLPVLLVGAANPFLDREIVARIGGVAVSGGWISFAVLAEKGILAFSVAWSLLRKTGVDGLTSAFAALGLPSSFGMVIRLMHRYVVMMVKETDRMKDAYQLRSGRKSRAILPSSWGPYVGLLLIRSMDRAANVQSAMELRGGNTWAVPPPSAGKTGNVVVGMLYFAGWVSFFAAARLFDPMRGIGDFLLGLR